LHAKPAGLKESKRQAVASETNSTGKKEGQENSITETA
jgi:hypothetical protein